MDNKKNFFIIIIIFFITGLITGIQFKQQPSKTDIITMKNIYERKQAIENEKLEIEKLRSTIEHLDEKLEKYNASDYNVDEVIISLQSELEKIKILIGEKDLEGPGIRIYMKDSDKYVQGQNINNFIIHNSDVLEVINDLKAAGAESIAINGSQIVWNSQIDCNGATIKVDDKIYAPPFIIEAIGDPDQLEAALNSPNSIVQLMKIWNIQVHITKVDNIKIKKRESAPQYKFLKIAEEGES
ncbi:DUF881 domain-containing protein [Garciella nitratireducens]|uniref:Uncharacterized conserved protein YlxW, UPF0749 family n=1 Tax=Garciella nitratireducens DSM 15102 TaxID=1121911 RepID=A0A1T4JTI5_9FIRM|nr:DUF881 domain-containing protein [Garciella nitratireducens]SJZ33451.1 Uncharacterized conserved protein YlxW, UPF0749 family [Garciella nitratireducens DSM 15102]